MPWIVPGLCDKYLAWKYYLLCIYNYLLCSGRCFHHSWSSADPSKPGISSMVNLWLLLIAVIESVSSKWIYNGLWTLCIQVQCHNDAIYLLYNSHNRNPIRMECSRRTRLLYVLCILKCYSRSPKWLDRVSYATLGNNFHFLFTTGPNGYHSTLSWGRPQWPHMAWDLWSGEINSTWEWCSQVPLYHRQILHTARCSSTMSNMEYRLWFQRVEYTIFWGSKDPQIDMC